MVCVLIASDTVELFPGACGPLTTLTGQSPQSGVSASWRRIGMYPSLPRSPRRPSSVRWSFTASASASERPLSVDSPLVDVWQINGRGRVGGNRDLQGQDPIIPGPVRGDLAPDALVIRFRPVQISGRAGARSRCACKHGRR